MISSTVSKYIFIFFSFPAEADRDVIKATGRSDPENMPSQLAKSIENMISNLMTMLRNAISGDAEDKNQAVAEGDKNQGEDVARNEIGGKSARLSFSSVICLRRRKTDQNRDKRLFG